MGWRREQGRTASAWLRAQALQVRLDPTSATRPRVVPPYPDQKRLGYSSFGTMKGYRDLAKLPRRPDTSDYQFWERNKNDVVRVTASLLLELDYFLLEGSRHRRPILWFCLNLDRYDAAVTLRSFPDVRCRWIICEETHKHGEICPLPKQCSLEVGTYQMPLFQSRNQQHVPCRLGAYPFAERMRLPVRTAEHLRQTSSATSSKPAT